MCVVSMVIGEYTKKWEPFTLPLPPYSPVIAPHSPPEPSPMPDLPTVPTPPWLNPPTTSTALPTLTTAEIEFLRKMIAAAREYDDKNNEPKCEDEEKKKLLKELAAKLGVEIDFI
jgi:hypothetical protein